MKFNLVFENSGDYIPFQIVYNEDLIGWFIEQVDNKEYNSFSDDRVIANTVDPLLTEIHQSLSKTNEVLWSLCKFNFKQNENLTNYLNQKFLNEQHAEWVFSQKNIINIDDLRFSTNKEVSKIGWQLHEVYPDEIREVKLAEAMKKLGYIYPYEEVNLTVHRLEGFFAKDIEFKAESKWEVIDNPFYDSFVSNNDVVNFSFGYTYVGRQYYNKWQFFDTELECNDHYNYETLEWAFQINLDRPQTIPFSKEFLSWCEQKQIKPISTQIPIGNVINLEKDLHKYRQVLYNNSKNNNQAKLLAE